MHASTPSPSRPCSVQASPTPHSRLTVVTTRRRCLCPSRELIRSESLIQHLSPSFPLLVPFPSAASPSPAAPSQTDIPAKDGEGLAEPGGRCDVIQHTHKVLASFLIWLSLTLTSILTHPASSAKPGTAPLPLILRIREHSQQRARETWLYCRYDGCYQTWVVPHHAAPPPPRVPWFPLFYWGGDADDRAVRHHTPGRHARTTSPSCARMRASQLTS